MTKRKPAMLPPPGLRKVPGARVWMAEDGTPYGKTGKLTPRLLGHGKTPCLSYMTDAGRNAMTSSTVANLMALTWMPPKPMPDAQIEHLDGDPWNNSAANLAWRVPKGLEQRRREYAERTLTAMMANPEDPRHGTKMGYDLGCRCRRCWAAQRTKKREYETMKTIKEVEACARNRQTRS